MAGSFLDYKTGGNAVVLSRRRQSWLFHRFRPHPCCGCPSLRSGIFVPAAFSSSYPNLLPARPLCSTGVTPLLGYYGPLRRPTGPSPRLCLPVARWWLSLPSCRASQAPRLLFPRALSPTTPGGPVVAFARCFTTGCRFHPSRRTDRLHLPNEAESGSLALRLACLPPESSSSITGTAARSATCGTGNLHGELLSVHKTNQDYPGNRPEGAVPDPDGDELRLLRRVLAEHLGFFGHARKDIGKAGLRLGRNS